MKVNVDIFMISEIEIGGSFLAGQFEINSFNTTFRVDRNQKGGGIMYSVANTKNYLQSD